MARIRRLHTIHLSSFHITRGSDYCDEFNLLGIVGDSVLCLLSDPVNCSELGLNRIISHHGFPAIAWN